MRRLSSEKHSAERSGGPAQHIARGRPLLPVGQGVAALRRPPLRPAGLTRRLSGSSGGATSEGRGESVDGLLSRDDLLSGRQSRGSAGAESDDRSLALPPADVDYAVSRRLLAQAAQARRIIDKLYWVASLFLVGAGLTLFRAVTPYEFSSSQAAAATFLHSCGQPAACVVFIMLVAFRNDFPVNIAVILLAVSLCSFLLGFVSAAALLA
jgi:hypothetical protein